MATPISRRPSAGPRVTEIYENMSAALCMQGKFTESIDISNKALKLEPDNARVYSGLLLTQQYLGNSDRQAILDRHLGWPGNRLSTPRPATARSATARPRRLRVGYVSGDFRTHSVAYFVESLLTFHDPKRYEITCYFSSRDPDETTGKFRKLAHLWRDVADLDDMRLHKLIVADGIDVLVDLGGHTSGGRLGVFSRRSAPVQVTCIGYPDTTGVTEMDYRLSDVIADPPGADRFCTEALYRLPGCFLCYTPSDNAPPVAALPADSRGHVTFGSFNNLAKVNQ